MTLAPTHAHVYLAFALLAAVSLPACDDAPDGEAEAHEAHDEGHDNHEGEGHWASARAAGVTPGSHADWCGEHGVPESLCTRCNPDLIPAFQATGDWCEEHQLPQSQCRVCNPGLVIERPPAEAPTTP
mgnify:CR=1 FL=1